MFPNVLLVQDEAARRRYAGSMVQGLRAVVSAVGLVVFVPVLTAPPLRAISSAQASPTIDAVRDQPEVETLELVSRVFQNTRVIRVLLPPGYRAPENMSRRYPVLYLNDGSQYFEPTAIDVAQVATSLTREGKLPPLLVIGIDSAAMAKEVKNQELDRADEYLPYPDIGFPPDHLVLPAEVPHPHGQLYPSFLVDEVMPLVNSRFRTLTGPADTGLGGVSYGGVAALYTALSRPRLIGKLMLESTPLWIGPDQELLAAARKATVWPEAVYLGLGTQEGDDDATVNREGANNQKLLADLIRAASPATRLKVVLEPGGRHRPPAWHRRLPGALLALWGS